MRKTFVHPLNLNLGLSFGTGVLYYCTRIGPKRPIHPTGRMRTSVGALLLLSSPAAATSSMAGTTACSESFSPWAPTFDSNGVFSLRACQGFFVQGDVRVESPMHYPPRLGLVAERAWSDVDAALAHHDAKLVVFLRHGEALHNADKLRVGAEAWEQTYQFHDEYTDAPLTATGIQQAVATGAMLDEELRGGGFGLDLVLVSPLDRTLNTYAQACGNLDLQVPVEALEIVRETLGVCNCDARSATAPKRAAFPSIDFSCIIDEDDKWWTKDHRETDAEIDERAKRFLDQLFHERSEKRILVVTHSGFTRACLRVLGHRYYRPANGELIPVIVSRSGRTSDEL